MNNGKEVGRYHVSGIIYKAPCHCTRVCYALQATGKLHARLKPAHRQSQGARLQHEASKFARNGKVKHGFIKVHIVVDMKTKQIFAIEVACEDAGDGCMFGRLVEGSTSIADVNRVIDDGVYDSKSNFQKANGMDADPAINVRRNTSLKASECIAHKFAVLLQLGNADWRRERKVTVTVGWSRQRSQALSRWSASTLALLNGPTSLRSCC